MCAAFVYSHYVIIIIMLLFLLSFILRTDDEQLDALQAMQSRSGLRSASNVTDVPKVAFEPDMTRCLLGPYQEAGISGQQVFNSYKNLLTPAFYGNRGGNPRCTVQRWGLLLFRGPKCVVVCGKKGVFVVPGKGCNVVEKPDRDLGNLCVDIQSLDILIGGRASAAECLLDDRTIVRACTETLLMRCVWHYAHDAVARQ